MTTVAFIAENEESYPQDATSTLRATMFEALKSGISEAHLKEGIWQFITMVVSVYLTK